MSKKYRPYFTLTELKIIQGALSSSQNLGYVGIINYLSKYITDIESGYRKENMSLKPDLLESLTESSSPSPKLPHELDQAISLLQRYKDSYFSGMTPAEISQVNQLRYENGLMTKEQEEEYEASLFSSPSKS